MCRSAVSGNGRRCPSHSTPEYRNKVNARRREQYQANKTAKLNSQPKLPDVHAERPTFSPESAEFFEHQKACLEFLEVVTDDNFDLETWKKYRDSDAFIYGEEDIFADLRVLDERTSVEFYTEQGYRQIKTFLSPTILYGPEAGTTKAPEPEGQKELQGIVDKIDSALAKAKPVQKPRMVYRGIKLPKHIPESEVGSWVDEHYPIGEIITEPAYLSTTLDPKVAAKDFTFQSKKRGVVFEIISQKGVAIGEGVSSQAMDEAEILMPRNTSFRVLSVDKNVTYKVGSYQSEVTVIRMCDAN